MKARPRELTGVRYRLWDLDHDAKVYGIFGEDPFVALQYAVDFLGELIDTGSARLGLVNRYRNHSERNSWVWRYDSQERA